MTRIIVMAKAPRAGLAKTRLAPALGSEGAAALAARMLEQALTQALAAHIGPVELCVTPDPSDALFTRLAQELPITLASQGDGDLGARMARALNRGLALQPAAIVIGSDIPALDAAYLRAAAAALATHEVVIGPATDGGYVLLGLTRPLPFLFDAMQWSHDQVLSQTRERLARAGVSFVELPPLADVDRPDDLVHVPAAWLDGLAQRLEGLRRALHDARSPWADAPLEPLADTGLAHLHVRLAGSGLLARIPKQSQLGLPATAHLAYEAACFERAAASGHTPRCVGVLPLSEQLPHGALLVEEVVGRPAHLPEDLDALIDTLAALHALPLPPAAQRAPLLDPPDALAALRHEIEAQAVHLDAARLEPAARACIDAERAAFARLCADSARPTRQLIAFDGHPGNFIVRPDGRAMLVDLEKARYSHAPLDLAHATLYTSTTWDITSSAVLDVEQIARAYRRWGERMGPAAAALQPWHVLLRRAMWLWSITWCAKWRVQSSRAASTSADGEDWSADLSDRALVEHVRGRVDHYLSARVVEQVCAEAEALAKALAA